MKPRLFKPCQKPPKFDTKKYLYEKIPFFRKKI